MMMSDPTISEILHDIDNDRIALPEFQRGYVWGRKQVRELFDSLYYKNPIGGLLVWVTESEATAHRGEGSLRSRDVNFLLDGQQRITSIYGVVKGEPPKFFEGDTNAFTGLHFHLDDQAFEFQHAKMKGDPLWVDVTSLMKEGHSRIMDIHSQLSSDPETEPRVKVYWERLSQLLEITNIKVHLEGVGADKGIEDIVKIFDRVNSSGTRLSKGDLALAKISTDWPEVRDEMKARIREWASGGYDFSLDWLLRSVNTVLTGEAKFRFLHDRDAKEIQAALKSATEHIHTTLNMIGGRLGLDQPDVLIAPNAVPVMVRYLDQKDGNLNKREQDKLLFWYIQAGIRGRFSGSTETSIDEDIEALTGEDGGLDRLIETLRLKYGNLHIEPGHFKGWSRRDRFYSVLYLLTRVGESLDWGEGIPLKKDLHGKMSKLERHHIFPKAQLNKHKKNFKKPEINALANYCFLTKKTNLGISDRLPEEYFPEIEEAYPGALESQWIPMDRNLWRIENFLGFLEARKELLAKEANGRMEELLGDDIHLLISPSARELAPPTTSTEAPPEDEDEELKRLNDWMRDQHLPPGKPHEHVDPETGESIVFDLAWPDGIQKERSDSVALLLNEGKDVPTQAIKAEFKKIYFSTGKFLEYVRTEILADNDDTA